MTWIDERNLIVIAIVCILIAVPLIFNIVSARRLKKKQKQFTENIYASYSHMKTIEDTSKKINEVSNEISELITENKDARTYIEENRDEIETMKKIIVTNDAVLDCVLSDKSKLAEEKGIPVTFQIMPGISRINMEDIDKIRLFSNLLDNAIEAAEKTTEQPFIHVSILKRGENFFITVENAKNDAVHVVENQFRTTKKDKENHGRGVRIIRQIVAKQNGVVQFEDNGNIFKASILL